MKAFDELENQNLRWVRISRLLHDYELRDRHGEVVATIKRPQWWSAASEVDAVGNRWLFSPRNQFWNIRITITSIGTGEEAGVFHTGWSAGTLKMADGREFKWKSFNFWGSTWGWKKDDIPVIGFQKGGIFRTYGDIKIEEKSFTTKAAPLLVFFGWYLITLFHTNLVSA